jgi:hypothetical protein
MAPILAQMMLRGWHISPLSIRLFATPSPLKRWGTTHIFAQTTPRGWHVSPLGAHLFATPHPKKMGDGAYSCLNNGEGLAHRSPMHLPFVIRHRCTEAGNILPSNQNRLLGRELAKRMASFSKYSWVHSTIVYLINYTYLT